MTLAQVMEALQDFDPEKPYDEVCSYIARGTGFGAGAGAYESFPKVRGTDVHLWVYSSGIFSHRKFPRKLSRKSSALFNSLRSLIHVMEFDRFSMAGS